MTKSDYDAEKPIAKYETEAKAKPKEVKAEDTYRSKSVVYRYLLKKCAKTFSFFGSPKNLCSANH
jgi:hypothetical protein